MKTEQLSVVGTKVELRARVDRVLNQIKSNFHYFLQILRS